MTRDEFEVLMTDDRWTREQRAMWNNLTPTVDAETFRREMARPDGLIEFTRNKDETLGTLRWRRFFEKRGHITA